MSVCTATTRPHELANNNKTAFLVTVFLKETPSWGALWLFCCLIYLKPFSLCEMWILSFIGIIVFFFFFGKVQSLCCLSILDCTWSWHWYLFLSTLFLNLTVLLDSLLIRYDCQRAPIADWINEASMICHFFCFFFLLLTDSVALPVAVCTANTAITTADQHLFRGN